MMVESNGTPNIITHDIQLLEDGRQVSFLRISLKKTVSFLRINLMIVKLLSLGRITQ